MWPSDHFWLTGEGQSHLMSDTRLCSCPSHATAPTYASDDTGPSSGIPGCEKYKMKPLGTHKKYITQTKTSH